MPVLETWHSVPLESVFIAGDGMLHSALAALCSCYLYPLMKAQFTVQKILIKEPIRGLLLSSLNPQGETHFLNVALDQLMRLRHNPFFAYVEHRVDEEIYKALQGDS